MPLELTRNFADDLARMDWFQDEPFCLVRFADGERAILERNATSSADGWTLPGPGFGDALMYAFLAVKTAPSYFAGISCPCCDAEGHGYFRKLATAVPGKLTFSNIFANANYEMFLDKCRRSPPRSVGWVGPYPANGLPGFLYPTSWVPRNLVNDPMWNAKIDRIVDKMIYESAAGPLFVSAGPCTKIICHRYWQNAANKQVAVDVGSALDEFIHERQTRGYHHKDHPNRKQVCTWST